jgi:hypothetical protein
MSAGNSQLSTPNSQPSSDEVPADIRALVWLASNRGGALVPVLAWVAGLAISWLSAQSSVLADSLSGADQMAIGTFLALVISSAIQAWVQHRLTSGAKLVQAAVNLGSAPDARSIDVDGVIAAQTLKALNAHLPVDEARARKG